MLPYVDLCHGSIKADQLDGIARDALVIEIQIMECGLRSAETFNFHLYICGYKYVYYGFVGVRVLQLDVCESKMRHVRDKIIL